MTHYHVNSFSDDGTGVAYADHVYRRREDAEGALEDSKYRATRAETPFTVEEVEAESVRECDNPACIGSDG